MTTPTRGFFGRRRERDRRLPPGQYDVGNDWPVLTAEPTPRIAPETWSITVDGKVANPTTWTWDQAHALPRSEYHGDIHCVTTWSKFDTFFAGISVDTLFEAAQPTEDAHFVMATSKTGYTTNLPLEDVTGGKAWVVWEYDGKPLPIEHGGPGGRGGAPPYFLQSAQGGSQPTPMNPHQPALLGQNSYHDHGDPWREQRYQGDD